MANITFNCTQCGQSLTIDETGAGMQVQCPSCAASLRVPTTNKPQIVTSPTPARQTVATPPRGVVPTFITPAAPGMFPMSLNPETTSAAAMNVALRIFFLVALLAFLLPVATIHTGANRESPLDVVLSVPSQVQSGSKRNLKELLVNGSDLAKQGDKTSMKVMLGVVLLWITSLAFVVFWILTIVAAIFFFGGRSVPSTMLYILLGCGVQFLPLTLISNSLMKAGIMEGGGIGQLFGGGGANIISPDWGIWILAAGCAFAIIWPKTAHRFQSPHVG